MPKVIYKADASKRDFITGMLSPVNLRREHRFGVWEAVLLAGLVVGTAVVLRLLMVH